MIKQREKKKLRNIKNKFRREGKILKQENRNYNCKKKRLKSRNKKLIWKKPRGRVPNLPKQKASLNIK